MNFRYLTTKDGLSDDAVLCIYQDRDGFMWFGTESGIDKYDGREVKKYYHVVRDTTDLFTQHCIAVHEDSYDGLWFSNDTNGLLLLNKRNDKSMRFKSQPGNPASLSSNKVRRILEDSKKNIWVATLGGGLNLFNRADSSFTHFLHDTLNGSGIGSNNLTSIAEDHKGNLWMTSTEGLLIKFNVSSRTFENILVEQNLGAFLDNVNSPVVNIDSHDNVWFLSNLGFYRLNQSNNSLKFYSPFPETDNGRFILVTSMIEWEPSKFLITTLNRGLFEFDASTGKFINYAYDAVDPFGISSSRLSCIFKSREGVVWIGSYDNGVNIISKYSLRFPSLMNIVQNRFLSYSSYSTYSICETPDGKIWMGTENRGIIEYDPQSSSLRNIFPELQDINVFDLYRDRKDNIWIGTLKEGLYFFDGKEKKINHIRSFTGSKATDIGTSVVRILEDSYNRMWLGYLRDGVTMFDRKSNAFHRFRSNPDDSHTLSNDLIFAIYEDNKHSIWIGTADGLNLYDNRKQIFRRVPFKDTQGKEISGISVYDILQDGRDRIWLATNKNLFLYDSRLAICISCPQKKGEEAVSVNIIIEDKNHFLWLGTNTGIFRFDPETKLYQDYGKSDGIRYLSFNPTSGLASQDGFIYLGSSNGVTIFNPDNIEDDRYIPPVYITGLSVNNIPVGTGVQNIKSSASIEYTSHIKLNYRQSTLDFQFAALNFNNPENNLFSYKLEGYEKEWSKPAKSNNALYTNLPPGKYIFKVTASNSHGLWNTAGKEMVVVITPPFWRTIWFRLLTILSFALLLVYIFYNRFYRLQHQKAFLEGIVNERTGELSKVNLALKEQREELIQQNEEISTQNEMLSQMSDEILKQNAELEQHRSNLEKLVEDRTRELEIAIHKAEESDKLKSAFLANMSHEIRTPMNAIVGFANLLKDDDIEQEERREFIDVINANSEVLLVLIDDILDLSLIEADQLTIKNEAFSLNEILDHLYSSFSLMNRKDDLTIRLNNELHENNLKIFSDRIRIKQILSNLINNAYKFTEKGFIELGLKKMDDQLVFYVQDSGIGIKNIDISKIFDRFRKSDEKKNTLYRGTGLGLAISKALAHLLGGSLSVESVIGQGSTFYFNLPFTSVTVEEPVLKQYNVHREIQKWTDKNILIAEDEEANYLYVQKMLGKMDINVYWAENGMEAVKLSSSGIHFDVILMDIKMPVMDGFEATKIIKANSPQQVVIALTAYARPEDRLHFMSAGFDDYLSKPIRPNDFMEVIKRYI